MNLINNLKTLPNHGQMETRSTTGQQVSLDAGADEAEFLQANQPSNIPTIRVSGQTYSSFNPDEDVVTQQKEIVTAGLWTGGLGSLTTFHTSSTQTVSQIRHYVDVIDAAPNVETREVQFALAYGHVEGKGSSKLGTQETPAAQAIYSQYRQLLLEKDATRFVTAGSGSTDYIYVVNIQRSRQKEKIDFGNWELPLQSITSHDTNATGSVACGSQTVTLIDDSSINSNGTNTSAGIVYNIVSGSIDNGVHSPGGSSTATYYGLFYPLHGIMVLDGKMLDQHVGFNTNLSATNSATAEGNNHFILFNSISGSSAAASGNIGFEARNEQEITSTHYFVRVKNGSFNFSNNPSYVTGSVGDLKQSTFVNNPKAYITTVGLYNSKNELLAVAKLSKPLLKSFSREALLRVKLDY